jgi:hypothetical protein
VLFVQKNDGLIVQGEQSNVKRPIVRW